MFKHLDNGTIFYLCTPPQWISNQMAAVWLMQTLIEGFNKSRVLTDFELYVAPLLNSFQNNSTVDKQFDDQVRPVPSLFHG